MLCDSTEEWRPVVGFEARYEVSSHGRVRASWNGLGTIFNPSTPRNTREYPAVTLWLNGVRYRRNIHRLVADAFLGPKPSAKHQVRHLDGCHTNNTVGNLQWGTAKDNADDREKHGRSARGERHGMYGKPQNGEENGVAKLTDERIRELRGLAGRLSQRKIAAQLGVTQGVVWRIIHNKAWTHV